MALGNARLPIQEFRAYGERINRIQASLLNANTVPDLDAFEAAMEVAFARLRDLALDERGEAILDERFLRAHAALCRAHRIGEQTLK